MAINKSGTPVSKGIKPAALELDRVSVEIEGTRLLDQISMQLPAGQVTAIVGPNGAGKSTLIKAISGQQKLVSGNVRFHSQSINDWSAQELARHMAVLPQRSHLNFGFTSREVVDLARTPHDSGAVEDKLIVDEVLSYLDASHLIDRLYPSLSGGEQQRIQLARVLAQIWPLASKSSEASGQSSLLPKLLLLDEPSSCFDLAHQQLLVQLVRELATNKDIAIVIVLHDLNMAMSCADTIAVLCSGQLYAFGKAEQVLDQSSIKKVFGVNAEFMTDPVTEKKHISIVYDPL